MPASPHRKLSARHVWAALLLVAAASTGLAPAADGDIWWHLAAGREMLERGSWLTTDPFSSGAAGRPWVDVHWLFQLLAHGVYERLGLAGLVACKCLLVGGGAVALFDALRRERLAAWARPLLVTLIVAALLAARSLLLVRPVVVTLVCMGLFIRELEHFRVDPTPGRIARLAVVQVLWSNCQGLSALGPALVGAYAAGASLDAWLGERRWWPFAREAPPGVEVRVDRAWAALGVCAAASLATPFGWRGAALSTALFERLLPGHENVYAHDIAENVPPLLLEHWSEGVPWHVSTAFAVLGVALLASRQRLRLSHGLLLVGFGGLALLANRNVLLFYWVASPIAALHLAAVARRLARRAARHVGSRLGRRAVLGANAFAFASGIVVSSLAAAREPSIAEPSPFRVPAGSAERLASLPGPGSLFAADHFGGYLIWQLYPRFRPYIDTRLVLRSGAEFAEYLALVDEPARFDAFQREHRFSYVVLPTAYPDRYLALIAHLYASPDWHLAYTDGSEVLFARADLAPKSWNLGSPEQARRIERDLSERFTRQPEILEAARLNLAALLIAVGESGPAEAVLAKMESDDAAALLARARFAAGDLPGARDIARRQLARDPNDVRNLSLLAQIALIRGDSALALSLLERALRAAPFDAEASSIMNRLTEILP